MRDEGNRAVFSDHLQLHLLQLANVQHGRQNLVEPDVSRWARFFVASQHELDALARESKTMEQAKKALTDLSEDRVARWEAEDRARSEATYLSSLQRAREEGRVQERRSLLRQILSSRFGQLPERIAERLKAAGDEALVDLTLRAATAASLDDVFRDDD